MGQLSSLLGKPSPSGSADASRLGRAAARTSSFEIEARKDADVMLACGDSVNPEVRHAVGNETGAELRSQPRRQILAQRREGNEYRRRLRRRDHLSQCACPDLGRVGTQSRVVEDVNLRGPILAQLGGKA